MHTRPPHQQRLLDSADECIEHQRKTRQHNDSGENRIRVEGTLGLQDQVTDSLRRSEIFADDGADECHPDREMQTREHQVIADGR